MSTNFLDATANYFKTPVNINCVVKGRQMTAAILGETNYPIDIGFAIKFSDGVRCEATANEYSDESWNVDNDEYKCYVDAIAQDLNGLLHVMANKVWYKFEISKDGGTITTWVGVDAEEDYPYHVVFNGDYQFSLKRENGKWHSTSVRVINPNPIDNDMVRKVVRELENARKLKKKQIEYAEPLNKSL